MRWLPLVLPLVWVVACAPTESMPEPSPNPASAEPVRTPAPEPSADAEPATPEIAAGCDAVAAARTALAALAEKLDPKFLDGCQPEQVVCESERRPLPYTQACQLFAYRGEGRWEIAIVPRPVTGAPTRIDVWVDQAGAEAGRIDISGSTFGVLEGVILEGHGEYASHTHGGPPAHVGGARFEVDNRREQPIELKLLGTRWLTAHSCELPREERAKPKPAGLALGEDLIDGDMTVTIPAGSTTSVSLGHAVQSAYMAYCDRFATAARFAIGGEVVEVIAEHHVVRREPLRRP